MAGPKEERREGYIELPHDFVSKLETHMALEEAREVLTDRIFKDGSKRMDEIEKDVSMISALVQTADGFVKAVRITAYVCGVFVALLGWVFVEKNNDIKTLQVQGNAHTMQINETLTVLKLKITQDDDRNKAIDATGGLGHGHARNRKY